jgi:hypothetical protein
MPETVSGLEKMGKNTLASTLKVQNPEGRGRWVVLLPLSFKFLDFPPSLPKTLT